MDASSTATRRTLLTGGVAAAATAMIGAGSASATTVGLNAKIAAIDNTYRGSLQVSVHDARSGRRFTYNPAMRGQCASIVKAIILTTVCYRAQTQRRALSATERRYATAMIRVSDNNSATWLWNSVGGAPAIQAMARRLGMYQTVASRAWGMTTTSASDQVLLMDELAYRGAWITLANRNYILGLMGTVAASQRWGVGAYGVAQNKNGWLPLADGWRINSIGHVTGGGRDYTAAILQRGLSSMGAGTASANRVAATLYQHLATPL